MTARRRRVGADPDDPLVGDDPLVPGELPVDGRLAVDVAPVQGCADRRHQRRVLVRDVPGVEPVGVLLGDEVRRDAALDEARVLHERREEADVVLHAADHEAVERGAHLQQRLVAGRAVGDELGDHRVVEHRDLAALVDAGVDAHAVDRRGRAVAHEPAGGGEELAEGVLGVDAGLHGPAVEAHLLLRQRQALAGGDAQHQLDQVEAGDELGDGVLDLQAGVHLEEVEAPVRVDHELDGPGGGVADRARQQARPARPSRAASRRRGTGRAPPRAPSGGGAAPSTRARSGTARCRGRRRSAGSRCAAAAR